MAIFDWVKEIEKIYEDLIEKAKKESLSEIQIFRDEQEKVLDKTLQKKQNIVNLSLKSVNEEVDTDIGFFKTNLEKTLKEIESNYEQNKIMLIKDIIHKLGLDFDA
ncbi:MAG: hypothetical protein ACXACC_02390 [Promethearchaeota archaeon]|jgi:23S rRNA G2069 N7-methylase RlmK/C1962 C5-methylase RlmI